MGYLSKVQVIERAKGQRQFYLICPAPLAQALEIAKGEPKSLHNFYCDLFVAPAIFTFRRIKIPRTKVLGI